MMNMMNTAGANSLFILLWSLHILSVVAFFVGILFLLFWAQKHLSAAELKKWGWILVVAGTILCLLTIGATGRPWASGDFKGSGPGRMMNIDADDTDGFRGMMGNGMGMSMNGMTMMLQGKTGDEFDKAFLQMMIPHHQGAIDMANLALENAQHDEIRNLANGIISAQRREIEQMEQWQKAWGYTK